MKVTEMRKQEPIRTKSIVEQATDRIIANIINGLFVPGEKLPNEYELMDSMGISRNSIREAIKILVAMGLLEIKRGDGTYVCDQVMPTIFDNVLYSMISSMSTAQELLELRQVLDETTVRMAAEKATIEEISELQENITDMLVATMSGDIHLARDYDYQFHMLLIDSCKNKFFSRLLKGVYGIFFQSIGKTVIEESKESKATIYHQKILDCVRTNNVDNLSEIVRDSLSTWRDRIKTEN